MLRRFLLQSLTPRLDQQAMQAATSSIEPALGDGILTRMVLLQADVGHGTIARVMMIFQYLPCQVIASAGVPLLDTL